MKYNLVIFDADPDGFGSAYAAWYKLGTEDTHYLETLHGSELPQEALKGYDNVYILDLSFSKEDYHKIRAAGSRLTVIDHHPSAKDDIVSLGLNPMPYDTEHAACVQAWEFFHPNLTTPNLLAYVADRDTWRFDLPNSDEINAFIYNTTQTFEDWDAAADFLEYDYDSALSEGKALVRYRQKLVDEMAADTTLVQNWQGEYSFYGIPFVAAPVLWSEVGHKLLDEHPMAPFSVTYKDYTREGYRKYSLRSEDHRVDVGAFAKKRGGGGHHNAAGFKKPLDDIWKEGYESLD